MWMLSYSLFLLIFIDVERKLELTLVFYENRTGWPAAGRRAAHGGGTDIDSVPVWVVEEVGMVRIAGL